MNNENIIDCGIYNFPTSWEQVTLAQYQELERIYSDKDKQIDIRDVLSVLTAHSKDEVDQLPIDFLETLLEALKWIYKTPEWGQPSNKVEISGETYYVNIQNKLKTGEYIAVDTILKSDKHNYAAIMAILCRKDGEIYDSKYENEVLEERIKMWEQQPVLNVMKVVSFFLQCYMILEMPTLLSMEVEEAINLERENIKNSRKNGDLSTLSTKLLIRKLRKLQKSIKSI